MRLPTVNDLLRAGTEQLEALVGLPGSIVAFNRSLTNLAQTVAVLDQLVRRLDRLTEPLEAPLTALAPRLEALVPLLDEEVIQSLPAVLDSVERNAVPALELMGHTRAQLTSISTSVERLLSIMEEGFSRLQELRGAFLVSRLRGSSRTRSAASAVGERAAPTGEAPRAPGEATAAPPVSPPPGPSRSARPSQSTEEHRSWRA